MAVNAAGAASADPTATLRLIVDWGDETSNPIGCGSCRLEHAYGSVGRFTLTATLTDGRSAALHAAADQADGDGGGPARRREAGRSSGSRTTAGTPRWT